MLIVQEGKILEKLGKKLKAGKEAKLDKKVKPSKNAKFVEIRQNQAKWAKLGKMGKVGKIRQNGQNQATKLQLGKSAKNNATRKEKI